MTGGEQETFGESRIIPVLPVEKIDIFCDPQRCGGPERVDRSRFSLARFFGNTEYEVCPVQETAIELNIQA